MEITDIIWDFDGTILPFDSEQALLQSLLHRYKRKVGLLKALLARAIAWGDRHGYLEHSFKRWYLFCLRGLPVQELDIVCRALARYIPLQDRQAIRALRDSGRRMFLVSCGTGDLCQRVLEAAALGHCFLGIEANWFTFRDRRIEGLDLHIHLAKDKIRAANRLGLALGGAAVIGDGITDLPLLDRARLPILVDRGGRKVRLAKERGYRLVKSLPEVKSLLANEERREA